MPQETPQHIARLRQVTADLVLAGRFDPGQYPHRHLAVIVMRGVWYERVAASLAAADVLATAGFELTGITKFDQDHALCAIFRRTGR